MKKKNELINVNSNESNLDFNFPNGKGTFEKGIDKRGNKFEKRQYENGDCLKQELLHNGKLKVTVTKKIK